jgi:hypothetical protein
MKTYNKLIAKNQFTLNKYVDEKRELAAKISDPEFAEMAQKDLGFNVTSHNIKGSREVVGIQKRFVNQHNLSKKDIVIIARELINVFKLLNAMPSKELAEIAWNE